MPWGDVGPPVEDRRTQRRRSSTRRVKRRAFLVGFALLGIASPAAATGGGTPGSARLSVTPPSPELGDVVLVELTGAPPNASVVWDGHALPLFPTEHGMAALVGIDLDIHPGPIGWRVIRPSAAKNC